MKANPNQAHSSTIPLTTLQLLAFGAPLAATWFMMALEGPFLSALIARLDNPKVNLAAFGVALSLAILVEAPVIHMLSASNALVHDRRSYQKLMHFLHTVNLSITAIMVLLTATPLFWWLATEVIGLPENVAHLSHVGLVLFTPWPAAIGYRRFYQGILIRHDMTRKVAWGTVIRILTVIATGFIVYTRFQLPGVYVAAISMSTGVTAEALATRFMARKLLAEVNSRTTDASMRTPLTTPRIIAFYTPLALTAIIALCTQPIMSFFLGHAPDALDSLAILPVVNAFMFLFNGIAISTQEVVVARYGNHPLEDLRIRNITLVLATALSGLMFLVAFTPLVGGWYRTVSGLSEELAAFAMWPTRIIAIVPALTVWISRQRGILVNRGQTRPIGVATGIEVATIVIALAFFIHGEAWSGAIAAATALVMGKIVDNFYMFPWVLRFERKSRKGLHTLSC